jgi:hypothetical protein
MLLKASEDIFQHPRRKIRARNSFHLLRLQRGSTPYSGMLAETTARAHASAGSRRSSGQVRSAISCSKSVTSAPQGKVQGYSCVTYRQTPSTFSTGASAGLGNLRFRHCGANGDALTFLNRADIGMRMPTRSTSLSRLSH